MNRLKLFIVPLLLLASLGAQSTTGDYVFFDDSPTTTSYDPSWGFQNAPSYLERVGEKFPVVTDPDHVFQGSNSLRLRWISNAGGNWGFAVAAIGWPGHDIYQKDTLAFWAYSDTAIADSALPLIYLEDLSDQKTDRFSLSDYSGSIPDSQWVLVKVPLDIFHSAAGNADLTRIKTIFYGQDAADGLLHTLYLDEIIMYDGELSDSIPPAVPTGLTAKGSDSHIDLFWEPNSETDLRGYNIHRSVDGGAYAKVGFTKESFGIYSDFVGAGGITATYKITAVDTRHNESGSSAAATATTAALTDDELLTMVQEATFRYFWDFAHPTSGLARERTLGQDHIVTIGGSGFGVMALLVGIERGFITREEGAQRLLKVLNFLDGADRFHGAWPHWMDGETGAVIPFSAYDDGGDLVETAFMVQGLLAARQYFDQGNATETRIDSFITALADSVEWDWYRKDNGNHLYWHWSPTHAWTMNFPLIGYNETMIAYLLAIASPTHGVPASLWEDGWAGSAAYDNGNTYYGYRLDVGWPYGGPLFFAHYSFLGFDPRYKQDSHTNYFKNNRAHTLINRAYCIDNPGGYAGYGENSWGLTASDDPFGYLAHEPVAARDNGTITPTAALSSMPYTPEESMAALKHFYHDLGDKLWGPFGFRDAFNLTHGWYAGSYLAIDQGPIIVMIENHRSSLLWDNFMANPEIQPMLDAIGFVPDSTPVAVDPPIARVPAAFRLLGSYPNPFNPTATIQFLLPTSDRVTVFIYNILGQRVRVLHSTTLTPGRHQIVWDGRAEEGIEASSGVYLYVVKTSTSTAAGKMVLQK